MKKEIYIIITLLFSIFIIQIFDKQFQYQWLQYLILSVMILLTIYFKLIRRD